MSRLTEAFFIATAPQEKWEQYKKVNGDNGCPFYFSALTTSEMKNIRKETKQESFQENFIRSFFEGNQYFLFVTETYRDASNFINI